MNMISVIGLIFVERISVVEIGEGVIVFEGVAVS